MRDTSLTTARPPARDAVGHRTGERAAPPTLIDCVVRSDAETKSGGDTVQVREYIRHLSAWGFDVREVPFHPAMRLRPGAVVHVFNIDRPFEFLLAARAARGHRLVVTPIHHELRRVRAMRAADRGRGLVSLSARVLPETGREWLATAYRAAKRASTPRALVASAVAAARLIPAVPRVWRAVGDELDGVAAVALLAAGEGEHLRALTGWGAANDLLVPNGRPEDLDLGHRIAWKRRPAGSIVVVGRIEPRKRQLELAAAADRLAIPVVFVGPLANEGSAYSAAFERIATTSRFVQHEGPRSRSEVLAVLGRSRVLVNGSWVEVQSLVDLEAASMGCAVVTTETGHSREWLGDAVTAADGDDLTALLRRAAARAEDGSPAPVAAGYEWTWEQAARRLAEAYLGS